MKKIYVFLIQMALILNQRAFVYPKITNFRWRMVFIYLNVSTLVAIMKIYFMVRKQIVHMKNHEQ